MVSVEPAVQDESEGSVAIVSAHENVLRVGEPIGCCIVDEDSSGKVDCEAVAEARKGVASSERWIDERSARGVWNEGAGVVRPECLADEAISGAV